MFTFQEIITKLTEFWSKQGCILHQGHDVEVGAGTFNPATFLRCLGPEPYKTAYVEPSRRPQDGRFGENPNRVQLFHQFQVIIKPSPLNIQELYLHSLEAIGIQLKEHDIRFVHDDWEGPTLGAWGLGWEVWFDGMEITQFTYFQAMAGLPTHPVSVEITYGLERLAMAVQNCNAIFAMKWNEEFSYGDICHQNEVEWSNYNFYKASTEMWLRHFEDFALEAKRLLQEKLPIPAYDFVIKASHAFNMLEARGILSVSERAAYITRIRELAKNIAALYLKSRQELGFPLLSKNPPKYKEEASKQKGTSAPFDPEKKGDFLLEIGSEELPATFVPIGCEQLKSKISQLLEKYNLSYKSLIVCGTPRRLALIIQDLSHGTKDLEIEKKGPLLSLAFDEKGTLTSQGRGFFQSIGREDLASLSAFEKKKGNAINIISIKEKKYLIALV
ncbi:MAG: glycine--tRNA ligase subunit alpha, partial [Simkania negevensis]|nr:glycine--tRNA ligase subunit alpha [Simkania negevensis]